ncbi:MAG: ABC transporter permease [Hyphomicrobiaceae bacterium]
MSGSYDRRPPVGPFTHHGRQPAAYGGASPQHGGHDEPAGSELSALTTHHGHGGAHGAAFASAADDWRQTAPGPGYDDLYAPGPVDPQDRPPQAGPIVPAGTVTGSSLTLVISIMTFLACLAVGAVWLINQSANAWLRDIASEITVQIEPKDGVDTDRVVADAERFLRSQPGVADARALAREATERLLEPWIGKTGSLAALPIPRLIAVRVDRGAAPDLESLRVRLIQRFPTASLDDHRQWQRQIRTVTRSFALGGLAILLLVCAATAAIIISATRSAMLSNREIVEVLHLVGATDRFIAREFERQFLLLGVKAGLVGALAAMAVFFLMPWIMQVLGGGTLALLELERLIGAGILDTLGYGVLSSVVLIIAGICMVTSRLGVYRILRTQT